MKGTSRETWTARVEGWKRSGLSKAGYASELGVNVSSLKWWIWKLGAEARRAPAQKRVRVAARKLAPMTFVEVTKEVAREPIELVLRDGRRIRVPTDFDEAALERLLAVVERRS
jgi:hypothetical protein